MDKLNQRYEDDGGIISSPWDSHVVASKREPAGQGLVEFAIMLPMLLLLIFGVIEFSRLMITYAGVTSASREAARYAASAGLSPSGVAHYQDCLEIRAAAERITLFSDPFINIEYDPDGPGGSGPAAYCQVGKTVDMIEASLGSRIMVRVTAVYQPSVPLVNLPPIPIDSQSIRTILKDVYVK